MFNFLYFFILTANCNLNFIYDFLEIGNHVYFLHFAPKISRNTLRFLFKFFTCEKIIYIFLGLSIKRVAKVVELMNFLPQLWDS